MTTSGYQLVRELWGDSSEQQCGVGAAAAPLRWSLGGHLLAMQMWWPSNPWHPLPSTLTELRGHKRGWKSWHRPQNLIVSSLEETFLACSGHLVARHLDSPFQELPHVPGETQPSAITLFPWRTPIKCSRQPQHCVGSPLLPPAPTWHQQGSLGAGARGWKGYTRGPAAGAVSRCRSINRSWLPNLLATAFHSLPVFSCFFLQGGACSPRQPSAPPLP